MRQNLLKNKKQYSDTRQRIAQQGNSSERKMSKVNCICKPDNQSGLHRPNKILSLDQKEFRDLTNTRIFSKETIVLTSEHIY